MRTTLRALLAFLVVLGAAPAPEAATIRFGGYEWRVRGGHGGPGPNAWDEGNVWLDGSGSLHLRIRQKDGRWSCAEVTTRERLGFGRYQFDVEGRIDQFDDNVVLGLFNYPTADVGADATHEIDMEFARWGSGKNPMGNFTVWPVEKALKPTSKTFPFTLSGVVSTHRFDWSATRVQYRSLEGGRDGGGQELARWVFEPTDPTKRIAQRPMPVHINLWLFQGRPPKDQKEVEVVIRSFRFEP